MRPLGDRRARVRYEVVGSFWGTLDVTEPARVININRTGALLAAGSPLAPDSIQVVRLVIEGRDVSVDAKVRSIRHMPKQAGQPEHYLVGLEFVSTPPVLIDSIDHITGRSGSAS